MVRPYDLLGVNIKVTDFNLKYSLNKNNNVLIRVCSGLL